MIRVFLILFIAATSIIDYGCDGCSCIDVDGDAKVKVESGSQSGSIIIEINGIDQLAPPAGERKVIQVNYTGNRTSGPEEGVSGQSAFGLDRNYEFRADRIPSAGITRYDMRPGEWEVSVSIGSWRASCTGTVVIDQGTRFIFNYNQSGCSH